MSLCLIEFKNKYQILNIKSKDIFRIMESCISIFVPILTLEKLKQYVSFGTPLSTI